MGHCSFQELNMKTLATLLLTGLIALGLGCGYSHSMTPTMAGTAPTINANDGLSPASGPAGTAVKLTVNGTLFASNAVVNFSGKQPTQWMSANQVVSMIPASATMGMASGTMVQVTVTNPGMAGGIYGGGTSPATSNSVSFTIN